MSKNEIDGKKKNNFALFLTWYKHDIGLNGLGSWREIVISLARTGGLGWSRKDYGYAGKVGRCEFKAVLVSTHSLSQLFVWDVNVCYILFLHISSSLFSLQTLQYNQPRRLKKPRGAQAACERKSLKTAVGSLCLSDTSQSDQRCHWFITMNEKVDIRIFLPEALCHPRTRLPSSPQCSFEFFSYLFVQ